MVGCEVANGMQKAERISAKNGKDVLVSCNLANFHTNKIYWSELRTTGPPSDGHVHKNIRKHYQPQVLVQSTVG